ncbi:alpha/beta fold hydrolase [Tsukamurella tyrosinosolvens]|uniref:alpha/beta fold hydrolase n=1 Tax=Tsukamurella tyrosinosolvens TaxID=57704 RepID=UPI000DF6A409|nr:alpha/beta fold hydrolase [Tsukamurella tyrosinosolvens]RDB49637.1 alpha/beta fold hydrolase [Tsukamurella tyrosinosolvens]
MTPAERVPESPAGLFVPLDDGCIHVVDEGDPAAAALLLIHGSGASLRSWDPVVPILAVSHRVIRIDLLGHGLSGKPPDGDYTTPSQGRRAADVLDHLGIAQATVVAHSSGGLAATALTEHRRDLVAALTLIDTGPDMSAFVGPNLSISPAEWPDLTDAQIRSFMTSAFSRSDYRIPQQLIDDVRRMTLHTFAATMAANRDYLLERALPERLAPLAPPLLVVFGDEDRRWRPSSAHDYRRVPGARVELLHGLGHSPMLEDPERTASHIVAFAHGSR